MRSSLAHAYQDWLATIEGYKISLVQESMVVIDVALRFGLGVVVKKTGKSGGL